MALHISPAKRGQASCIVFGLAVMCVAVTVLLTATMPPPTGGGEFRGVNNVGRVFAALGLLMAAWGLSALGCVLAVLGLRQLAGKRAAAFGLVANALVVGATTLWFMSN